MTWRSSPGVPNLLQGTDSAPLTYQPPDCSKPNHQGFVRAMEYRSGDNRNLIAAMSTLTQNRTNQPSLRVPTVPTTEAFWPLQLVEIVAAGFVRGGPAFEFRESLQEVFHATHIIHIAGS